MKRVVRDFRRGVKIFVLTMVPLFFLSFLLLFILASLQIEQNFIMEHKVITGALLSTPLLALILSILGFRINYVPVKVINGVVSVPASDQLRTFTDLITMNPITGLYRRRVYNVDEIENVANGYTNVKRGKKQWNVVISGMRNGKSFSQRIDCSNKQVRDEVRNVLKQTIAGKVNSDFAI